MKRFVFLLVALLAIPAFSQTVGNVKYHENVKIGGGYGDSDGGADLEYDGDIKSDGSSDFDGIYTAGSSNIAITDATGNLLASALTGAITVSNGGTGLTTITDHSLVVGSGTGAITPLAVATNGQLAIGSTGADPVVAALTGTANQLTVTNGAGTITLSLPQNIHTGASPTFVGLTLSGDLLVDGTNIGITADADLLTLAADLFTIAGTSAPTTLAVGPLALPANMVAHVEADTISDQAFRIHLADSQSGSEWQALVISTNDNFGTPSGIAFETDSITAATGPAILFMRTSGTEADLTLYATDADARVLLITLDGSAQTVIFPTVIDVDGNSITLGDDAGGDPQTIYDSTNDGVIQWNSAAQRFDIDGGDVAVTAGDIRLDGAIDPTLTTICTDITIITNQVIGQWSSGALDDDETDLDSAKIVVKAAETWGVGVTGSKIQIFTTPIGSGTTAVAATFLDDKNLVIHGGVIFLNETTTPTPIASSGAIYTKSNNELFFQDGDGNEHLLHGNAFSSLWFNKQAASTTAVTIGTEDLFTLIDTFESIGPEDDLANVVGNVGTDLFTIGANGAGSYDLLYHASVTAAGGVDKVMMFTFGVTFNTPLDITNADDNADGDPITITSTAHDLLDGDMVRIAGISVKTEANGDFIVTSVTTNTFDLVKLDGTATTNTQDYNEGSPTGDVTVIFLGSSSTIRSISGSDLGVISGGGDHSLAVSDTVGLYVANQVGTQNLEVASVRMEIIRIGGG